MDTTRILVAYGTRNGSTAEIAEMIANTFISEGIAAEARNAASVRDMNGYSAVVLGGALYAGRWHRDSRRFARRFSKALRELPVWLFSSGPLDHTADTTEIPPVRQVMSVMSALDARGHRTFGGKLTEGAKGFIARAMVRNGNGGDYRNQERIEQWTREILSELRPNRRTWQPTR